MRICRAWTSREGDWVWRGETVGAVGSTGNAAGKPPHLHYAIITAMPYPWRITTEPQGWQKMFFLDPGAESRGLTDASGALGRQPVLLHEALLIDDDALVRADHQVLRP